MRAARGLAAALLALAAACAAPRGPKIPEGEDYLFPRAKAGELRAADARKAEQAWRDVLSVSVASAEKA